MRKVEIPSVLAGRAKYWDDERIDDLIDAYEKNDEVRLRKYQDSLL